MSKPTDPCPCGSGKSRQACCGHSPIDFRLIITSVLILVTAGGLTALALTGPGGGGLALLGTTPQPWEYDAINNRHWHAEHGHWHPGPPPPESGKNFVANTPLATPPVSLNDVSTSQPARTGGTGGTGGAAGIPASTPLPWQYDAENDRHWHAGHGHWHPGPPPAGVTGN